MGFVRNRKEECELDPNLFQESSCEEIETKILLRNALNSLSDLQRNILIKRYFKDYSDEQIACTLNISRQAVNRTKNRALEKLRKLIVI